MKNNNQNLKTFRKKLRIIKKFYALILCILIAVIAMRFYGCSDDPTSSNNPPPSTNIGTLTVTPDIITANVSDTIIARLKAGNGIYFTDSLAKLVKTDNNGNIISEYGQLLDNGSLENGDEISRDNIYSGKFIVTESAAGQLLLKAVGNVAASGTTSTQNSNTVSINIYSQLNSGEVGIILSTQNNAANQLQTFLAGNPNNIEAASNQLKSWLETQNGVQSAVKEGNTSITIRYNNGLSGGLIFSVTETRGGFESDTLKRESIRKIPADRQTTGENSNVRHDRFVTQSDNVLIDPNSIGNRNVLIYAPYEAVWVNNERPLIKARLEASQCKDFSVTEYVNQNATIGALLNMTDYGLIFFSTHGSGGSAILTGEIVDTNSSVYKDSYKAMLQAGRISIFTNVKINNAGTIDSKKDVYAIMRGFILSLSGTFPNTVIMNNSCYSTMKDSLYSAFFSKGAKTYYGYDKVVNGAFAKTMADSVAKRLAVTGLTTGQTYFNASDPQSPNAAFQKATGGNDNLKYNNSLLNGNFEEGSIIGWTKNGDGRVITRLGFLNAPQGTYMGIISTGLGYTTSSGSISQCMTVENNQSTLKIKWNFLSEEFLEYINSQFQDYFKIILKKQDGTEVTLYSKTIDEIASMFGATQQNPGQLIAVSPNIVFDVGGVYMTDWQTISFDITPYRGQLIVIRLVCGDVGDSIYDTAILLDEISVN